MTQKASETSILRRRREQRRLKKAQTGDTPEKQAERRRGVAEPAGVKDNVDRAGSFTFFS